MAGLCPSNLHVETPIPSMRFEMEMLTARCENYPAYYDGPILISRSSEGANSRQSSGGLGKNVRAIRRPAFLPQRRRPCQVRVPNGEGVRRRLVKVDEILNGPGLPNIPIDLQAATDRSSWIPTVRKVHSEGKSIFENIPKFNFIDENLERETGTAFSMDQALGPLISRWGRNRGGGSRRKKRQRSRRAKEGGIVRKLAKESPGLAQGRHSRPWPQPHLQQHSCSLIAQPWMTVQGDVDIPCARRMVLSAPAAIAREGARSQKGMEDQQRASRLFASWASWESLTVNISGLPKDISTFTIWRSFKVYGSIEWVEIFEDTKGRQDGRGKIRFRPPPREVFCPDRRHILELDDGQRCLLQVHISPRKPSNQIPSPINLGVMYPMTTEISVGKLDFGTLIDKDMMLSLRTVDSSRMGQIRFIVDLNRREIVVFFNLSFFDPRLSSRSPLIYSYRFRIPFVHLSRVLRTKELGDSSLVIVLDSPPIYHRRLNDVTVTFSDTENTWKESDCWFRQTDIPYSQNEAAQAPLSLRKAQSLINIVQDAPAFGVSADSAAIPAWRWIDPPIRGSKRTSSLQELVEEDYTPLPFSVRYQLEVCLSHGFLNEYTIGKEFVTALVALGETKARELLEHVASEKHVYYDPKKIFDILFVKPAMSRRIPKYCCYMRTARVTPSTVYFGTPSVDITNRVIRHYIEYADRFLRVRFTDEKFEGRIQPSHNNTMDEVFTRVKRTMMNGITLGDRHYEFLAFGNSQFREHGAYFFASLPHLTAANIRAWMGHFSDIKEIARHAARLGQCFSTTRAVTGCPVQIREIEDIQRNGYTFSDGVGRISRFLAQMVMTEFKIKTPCGEPPSVFQFRLGGCKGILTVSPEAQRQQVHIRKSQYKFPAIHNGLEVIRHSHFCMASLNRQLIVVLSSLEVPDEVFLEKLRMMLGNLELAMTSETQAIHLLHKYIDPNQMTLVLAEMIQDGFQSSKEPFVTSLLELWRAWQIKYLKEKAKIIIEEGACLFGCLDETGTLKGFFHDNIPSKDASYEERLACLPEIFVQISRANNDGKYEIIEGPCIIARNPSLHPGDIRVVKAVNAPALHHLRDVIVFPQTGDRDIPSMCSGGDLDGDDYLVIWDQDLLPKDWFKQPMNYAPSVKALRLSRDVTVNDITSFFVTYMKNDRLAQIAHSHLAWADYLEKGVNDSKCIRLAELHSAAVDYNKTGIPAKMTKDLAPRKWPHFMEKKHKPKDAQYISQKILGKLYDIVERVNYRPKLEAPFDDRILNSGIEVNDDLLAVAAELKVLYDADMCRIMAQHEIKTEFEVWSTFVLSHSNMSKDYKFHEEIGQISCALRERFRNLCCEKAGGKNFEHLAPLAVAMYKVTCNEMTQALAKIMARCGEDDDQSPWSEHEEKLPLISFPWLLQPVLGKIVNKHYDPACLEEVGLWSGQASFKKRKDGIDGNSSGTRDVETAGGVQHAGEVLELFQGPNYDPRTGLDATFDRPGASPGETDDLAKVPLGNRSPTIEGQVSLSTLPLPENDEVEDIIEQEGEIKPSAIDELEALLGM
ncbi:RNA-directed RNA polymerase Rdp1 [Coccidioides immitis RMSCC 3703]|uniref:RNA-directed RNA polymerase n=1 Tax=Coccidioides immitis RMSCC 3703 TaxID=454286 RepID=A0A0J8R9D7_COCIT|nr:RNA-directed RNA polymerase Rdp1 [Coccidioides immitis RMSCC 3703]